MTTKDELLAAVHAKSAEIEILIASAWPAALPAPTPSSPTPSALSFTAPSAGTTLKGSVNPCQVNGLSDTAYVRFYVDDAWIKTTQAAPWACNLDTIGLKSGSHTLKAIASNAAGISTTATLSINVQNGTTVPVSTGAISAADVIDMASADIPFVDQKMWWANANGEGIRSTQLSEAGINGSKLSNGETLRLGKQTDPADPARKALAFQLSPGDAITNGSHRCEIECEKHLQYNKVYWIAFRAFVYDWGTLPVDSEALFGFQFHSGDTEKGFSPSLALVTYGRQGGGRTFQVWGTFSKSKTPNTSNAEKFTSNEIPIPFGRWVDFVFKVKENVESGLAQAWMDGNQIMNYTGPVGYLTPGINSYGKFGFYNWSGTDRVKKVLLRNPCLIVDSGYRPEQLRAFVNQ